MHVILKLKLVKVQMSVDDGEGSDEERRATHTWRVLTNYNQIRRTVNVHYSAHSITLLIVSFVYFSLRFDVKIEANHLNRHPCKPTVHYSNSSYQFALLFQNSVTFTTSEIVCNISLRADPSDVRNLIVLKSLTSFISRSSCRRLEAVIVSKMLFASVNI